MANPDNIKGQGFHTNPERANRGGRPKGALNRSTIARRWLEAAGSTEGITVADELFLAQIKKAMSGDTAAFNAAFDSGMGKVTDKLESTGANGEPISHEVTVKVITK